MKFCLVHVFLGYPQFVPTLDGVFPPKPLKWIVANGPKISLLFISKTLFMSKSINLKIAYISVPPLKSWTRHWKTKTKYRKPLRCFEVPLQSNIHTCIGYFTGFPIITFITAPCKWPLTPKLDMATWAFWGLSDMRHRL